MTSLFFCHYIVLLVEVESTKLKLYKMSEREAGVKQSVSLFADKTQECCY